MLGLPKVKPKRLYRHLLAGQHIGHKPRLLQGSKQHKMLDGSPHPPAARQRGNDPRQIISAPGEARWQISPAQQCAASSLVCSRPVMIEVEMIDCSAWCNNRVFDCQRTTVRGTLEKVLDESRVQERPRGHFVRVMDVGGREQGPDSELRLDHLRTEVKTRSEPGLIPQEELTLSPGT
ncbi:unnamed protein product [Pleuronectes platessa]|uniref:Uncharacterized protein n=1 Tax=Pleuronectes platessa TaxID=8262 RepID=A0A9N7VCR8_PLEPL|nr:unnamed protein product [Pleuronectes platessa]